MVPYNDSKIHFKGKKIPWRQHDYATKTAVKQPILRYINLPCRASLEYLSTYNTYLGRWMGECGCRGGGRRFLWYTKSTSVETPSAVYTIWSVSRKYRSRIDALDSKQRALQLQGQYERYNWLTNTAAKPMASMQSLGVSLRHERNNDCSISFTTHHSIMGFGFRDCERIASR